MAAPISVGDYVLVTPRGWALDQRGAPARVSEISGDEVMIEYPVRNSRGLFQIKIVGKGELRHLTGARADETKRKFLEA